MPKAINITGQRFGRLIVMHKLSKRRYTKIQWMCKCDCGKQVSVTTQLLRRGDTRSCGCINLGNKRAQKHGFSCTPEYRAWVNMRARCLNKHFWCYKYYGGRGITVCSRWLESVERFLEDMGSRPAGFTLDRIDNDGNYEPVNCRWTDRGTQITNSRRQNSG